MIATMFPATLTDQRDRIWTLCDENPPSAQVSYARYEHEGRSGYYCGGDSLHSVRFSNATDHRGESVTVCQPGREIAILARGST